MMAAVKYLVEGWASDFNAVDREGYTAMPNADARGDVEMILYPADMANGPGAADSAVAGGAAGEVRGGEQS